jgi:hypothetical protein
MSFQFKMDSVAKTFAKINELKKKEERISALKQNNNLAVRTFLAGWFDPNVKFLLPEGVPPYRESKFDEPKALLQEIPRFYLFVEGGNPNLKQIRREQIFIEMLERINADDAKLLISMKDKKCPFKGITKDMVNEAIPGLIKE